MRVIDLNTQKVCEIGLFADSCIEGTIKIRLLELPLVFGNLGSDVGYLGSWKSDDGGGISYSLDSDAVEFFELDYPFEDTPSSPQAALESIIRSSPRFRAALEPDKIEA